MYKELLNIITKFKEDEKSLKDVIRDYVKDKRFPLDERWDIFIKSDFGDICSNVYLESVNNYMDFDEVVDDYNNIDSKLMVNIIYNFLKFNYHCFPEELTEKFGKKWMYGDIKNLQDYMIILVENVICKVKEEILEKFIKSFEFDGNE